AFAQITGVTRDVAGDRKILEAPWRGALWRGRAPQRHDWASDGRRNMHRSRVRPERRIAFGKNRDQITQRGLAREVQRLDAAELAHHIGCKLRFVWPAKQYRKKRRTVPVRADST